MGSDGLPPLEIYSANERQFLEESEKERELLLGSRRSFLRAGLWSLLVGGLVLLSVLTYDAQIDRLPKFAIAGVYFFWAMCVSHPFYQYAKLAFRPTPGSSAAWRQYWIEEGLQPGKILPDLSPQDIDRLMASTSTHDQDGRSVVANLSSIILDSERAFEIPARTKTKHFRINR